MNEQKIIDEVALECMKRDGSISQLEKDILSINQLCMERPLDRIKRHRNYLNLIVAIKILLEVQKRYRELNLYRSIV